jgi:hypothetical protein
MARRVARPAADGARKMEGVGVTAIVGDFAQGEAGGADKLDGVFNLETPDHDAGTFAPRIVKKPAEPAGGNADPPGELSGGTETGVISGGDLERAPERRMGRGAGRLPAGKNLRRETEKTGAGERGHGVVEFRALIRHGEPFLDQEMDGGRGLVSAPGGTKKTAVRRRERPGRNLAPGMFGIGLGREAEKFADAGRFKDSLAGNEVVRHSVDRDAEAAPNDHHKLEVGLEAGPKASSGQIEGFAKKIFFSISTNLHARGGGLLLGRTFHWREFSKRKSK